MSDSSPTPPADPLVGLFVAHPWHGLPAHAGPGLVNVYVEIVPADTVKFEVHKPSGHLTIDRPRRYAVRAPAPYGFIPRTYCAEDVAAVSISETGRPGIRGDGDPLDVMVLTENDISRGGFLLRARPVGGIRLLDAGEADDKIIAVLEDDAVYGEVADVRDLPDPIRARLRHYFLTYKQEPDREHTVEVHAFFGREAAEALIARSQADYARHYGDPEARLAALADALRARGDDGA